MNVTVILGRKINISNTGDVDDLSKVIINKQQKNVEKTDRVIEELKVFLSSHTQESAEILDAVNGKIRRLERKVSKYKHPVELSNILEFARKNGLYVRENDQQLLIGVVIVIKAGDINPVDLGDPDEFIKQIREAQKKYKKFISGISGVFIISE
jgi:hypothetical protein